MKPSLKAVIAVALVVVVVSAILFAIHRVHIARREAAFVSLVSSQRHMDSMEADLADLGAQYDIASNDGSNAGQKRHDRAENSADASELLTYAKRESAAVAKAQALNETITDSGTVISQAYSSLYGSASSRLQSEVNARHDSCELALNDWGRAIGDIQDSLQASVNGSFEPSGDSEQYYSNSEREDVQCDRHTSNVREELKKLDQRLSSEIRSAEAALNGF